MVSVTTPENTGPDDPIVTAEDSPSNSDGDATPPFEDPSSDEDDGGGEWITPSNVELHKSRALELLPVEEAPNRTRRSKRHFGSGANESESITTGCMTADFAMQNVLLQMGLNLIGVEGKRINRVKTWVLRCHACFKYVMFVLVTAMSTHCLRVKEFVKTQQNSFVLPVAIPHCSGHQLRYALLPPRQTQNLRFRSILKETSNGERVEQNTPFQHLSQDHQKPAQERALF